MLAERGGTTPSQPRGLLLTQAAMLHLAIKSSGPCGLQGWGVWGVWKRPTDLTASGQTHVPGQ